MKNSIAELTLMLPMFIGTLLKNYDPKLSIKLNPSEENTLMFVNRHSGEPMTEYSKKISISKGSFTYVADRLEQKGLITRVPFTNDRRKNMLQLTDIGKKLAQEIITQHNEHIARKLTHLSQNQLNNLKNALEVIVETTNFIKEGNDIFE